MGSKTKTPAAPNYTATAVKQADASNAMVDKTNDANRLDQTNAFGGTSTFDPVTGAQTTKLGAEDQARLDAQRGTMQGAADLSGGLMKQAANSMANPLDTSGYQALNPNALDPGFGAVQQVKDDYLNLMKPQMDQERQTMESTLKQRGIPMNSPAWNAAMNQLSDSTARRGWEATGKATDAYNDIFNRGLKGNEQANATRKQQLEEGITTRELPLTEALAALRGSGDVSDPKFQSYVTSGKYGAPDYMTAEQSQYQAAMDAANAAKAKKSGIGGTIGGLLGGVAGSFVGMPTLGASLGSSLGGQVGGR